MSVNKKGESPVTREISLLPILVKIFTITTQAQILVTASQKTDLVSDRMH